MTSPAYIVNSMCSTRTVALFIALHLTTIFLTNVVASEGIDQNCYKLNQDSLLYTTSRRPSNLKGYLLNFLAGSTPVSAGKMPDNQPESNPLLPSPREITLLLQSFYRTFPNEKNTTFRYRV